MEQEEFALPYEIQGDEWFTLYEFPDYDINPYGEVVSKKSGRSIPTRINRQDVVMITLTDENGEQKTRSLAKLVAECYRPKLFENWDTVIFLDGDRHNVRADNLQFRSRPYAIYYHEVINRPRPIFYRYLVCTTTGEVFDDYLEPAMKYGINPIAISNNLMSTDHPGVYPWGLQFDFGDWKPGQEPEE